VGFEFMHGRTDVAVLEDGLDLVLCEIRDPDVFGEASSDKLFHGEPGVQDGGFLIDNGSFLCRIECYRPMHQVEIQIVDTQIRQCLLESWLDVLWSMSVIPQLRCDPY